MELRRRLAESADGDYRAFQLRLVPGIPPETVVGVRTPGLRALARELCGTAEGEAFLREVPHALFEENLIHFFMLERIRDFDRCAAAVDAFLPYVDCWPVSDQARPPVFRKNHARLMPWIRRWIRSEHVYTARFGLRMLMNEFLGEDFSPECLELAASRRSGDYYLNMMTAWFFATALAKRYGETVPYMEQGRLDEWVRRRAIQKALESGRVTEEHKACLRRLRQTPGPETGPAAQTEEYDDEDTH